MKAQDKIADIEMKLMDIDSEHLGIPESEYDAIVRMPSDEFAKICKDLSSIGDTGTVLFFLPPLFCSLSSFELLINCFCSNGIAAVVIAVTKEGIRFSSRGDIGTANIVWRKNTSVDNVCVKPQSA